MEIILTKPVETLGKRGDIVHVADGYARNYLLPRGMAITATKGARRQAESMQRAEERREQVRRDDAEARRERLHGKAVTVRARATDAGRLYGSVSPREIVEALRQTHGLEVDPHTLHIDEPIREVGTHTVNFVIYHDITAEVEVTVRGVEGEGDAEGETDTADATAPEPTTATADTEAAPARPAPLSPKPKPIITDHGDA